MDILKQPSDAIDVTSDKLPLACFSYPTNEQELLSHVKSQLAEKRPILLTGAIGSGKSTFVQHLIDDLDIIPSGYMTIRHVDSEERRQGFAHVPAANRRGTGFLTVRHDDLAVFPEDDCFLIAGLNGRRFYLDRFYASVSTLLDSPGTLVVLDELGGDELLIDAFYKRVLDLLADPTRSLILVWKHDLSFERSIGRSDMTDQQKLLIRDRRDSIASHPSLAHVELVNGSQSATHRRRTSWPGSALQTDSQEPETPAVLTDQSLDSEHSDDEIISERSETRDKEQTHALAHGASDSTKRRKRTRKRMSLRFTIMVGALLAIIIVSFAVGWYGISPGTIIKFFWSLIFPSGTVFPQEIHTVLINIRLPRIALGLLVGSGLAVAGHTFQGVFRNPMASPDVLGASSGAGFGAALAILWGYSATGITAMSFFFGLVSIGLVLVLTSFVRSQRTLSLILTGIVVGSLFSAGLSFIKFVADPTDQLPAITYWLMGSLNSSQLKQLTFAAPPILAGLLVIILLRWQLNVLMFGEEAASTMGVRTRLIRIVLIIAATLITATCVSVSGIIGWVGLVVPHIARMITGTDNRLSLPASALIGSGFLIFVDDIARRATTSGIPLGILTAFVGAPFFIFLILRQGRRDVAA